MKQGIIFTKDKTEIDVFFLKEQVPPELSWQLGHQMGDGSADNPILVDEETGKALANDLEDCCEQGVNENSAGEGHHASFYVEDIGGSWPHALTQEGVPLPIHPDDVNKVAGCCPVGPKGETGWKGYDSLYDAILDSVRSFKDSELNIASETAQEILAMSIERKVNNYYDKK